MLKKEGEVANREPLALAGHISKRRPVKTSVYSKSEIPKAANQQLLIKTLLSAAVQARTFRRKDGISRLAKDELELGTDGATGSTAFLPKAPSSDSYLN